MLSWPHLVLRALPLHDEIVPKTSAIGRIGLRYPHRSRGRAASAGRRDGRSNRRSGRLCARLSFMWRLCRCPFPGSRRFPAAAAVGSQTPRKTEKLPTAKNPTSRSRYQPADIAGASLPVLKQPQLMSSPRARLNTRAARNTTISPFTVSTAPGSQMPASRHRPRNSSSHGSTSAVRLIRASGRIW